MSKLQFSSLMLFLTASFITFLGSSNGNQLESGATYFVIVLWFSSIVLWLLSLMDD